MGLLTAILAAAASAAAAGPATAPATAPASIPVAVIPDRTFNVMQFCAKGDGKTDDTAHLQAAIDAAAAAGGGTVLLPSGGTFVSNFLTVKASHIAIRIDGTLAAQLRELYSDPKKSLITFSKSHDVELCGSGTIDGRGELGGWWGTGGKKNVPAAGSRPRLVRFADCDTVFIHDITMRNSPSFHIIFGKTNNVIIRGIKIVAPSSEDSQCPPGVLASHNTDGVDPHGSNYLIENCDITCGDDNIAIAPSTAACNNIVIRHCTFGTGHGVSIGGGPAGVDGVTVTDCTFTGTTNGIRLKSNRETGGKAQNLLYSNLTMKDVRLPILFTSHYGEVGGEYPKNPADDPGEPAGDTTPTWQNITLRNVTISNGPPKGVAGIIWGLPEAPSPTWR